MRQLWAAAAYGASADSVHHPRSPGKSCSRWQGAHLSGPQTGEGSGRSRLQPSPTSPFLSRIPIFSFVLSPSPHTQITPTLSSSSQSQPQAAALTNPLTSWWGKALHCSSTKQFRKGKGMKQKSMIRKTAPLITPWDSGLWASIKPGGGGRGKGAWSLTSASTTIT